MASKYYRVEMFKPTRDDWHPNYRIAEDKRYGATGFVRVSFLGLNDGVHRVCVWGADDMGMERDFKHKSEARGMFKILTMLPSIEKAALLKHGFERA